MRIGILTLPLHTNYGGILQAYALQTALEQLGHEAYLVSLGGIERKDAAKGAPKEMAKKMAYGIIRLFRPNFANYERRMRISSKRINEFIGERFPRTLRPRKFEELKALDALVVGSDQVWRMDYAPEIRDYYLGFARRWKIRRLAYAASFGSNEWTYPQDLSAECGELLKLFVGVSVRESDAVGLCKEHFGIDAVKVLDPTLLLSIGDYGPFNVSGRHFLTYILDEDEKKAKIAKAIGQAVGKDTVANAEKPYVGHDARRIVIHKGVEEWLGNIASASFVFTDSFHGCAFSILFNKPFAVALNPERGNPRFHSLLSEFGLLDRIVENESDALALLEKPIEWERINATRAKKREESLAFLRLGLGGNQ